MKTLNIIGGGHVGKTLGHLFHIKNQFQILNIVNQKIENAILAKDFIGQGQPVSAINQLTASDVYLLSVPDREIFSVAAQLAKENIICAGSIVFHCSGALASNELNVLRQQGALVASLHPIMSFANPNEDIHHFSGVYCALEGDELACQVLRDISQSIGAHVVNIKPEQKILYHAANVFCCNYLVALIDLGLQTFEHIGISRSEATAMLQPIMEATLSRIIRCGPTAALTGPIARGDFDIVAEESSKLLCWSEDAALVYQSLGRVALKMAINKSSLSSEVVDKLHHALSTPITSRS